MISSRLEESLQKALSLAKQQNHEYATLEHLLVTLTEDPDAIAAFKALSVKINMLKKDLIKYLIAQNASVEKTENPNTRVTVGFQRVLQRASLHAQSTESSEITAVHVLISIFSETDSYAVQVMKDQKMTRTLLVNYEQERAKKSTKSNDNKRSKDSDSFRPETQESEVSQEGYNDSSAENIIEKYCVNLNKKALDNQIEPMIGRDDEINRVIHILCRRSKNNPLLLGDSGVGKTALIEGLAHRLAFNHVPPALEGAKVYALDMGGLVAGTRFRGDFEERFKAIVKALEHDQGKSILFIDEAHTIVGTGSVQGGSMDTSNLLKPALMRSKIRCIAATTFKEYKSHLEKDTGLLRRFQKVEIKEPTLEESVHILEGLQENLEEYHHVHFKKGTLETAVDLSVRHIMDRRLPDKAIDVLDEAGAKKRLESKGDKWAMVTVKDIEDTIARMASIPAKQVSQDDKKVLRSLEKSLQSVVFGQDRAVKALVHSIKLSRSGLRSPEKPVGCYLFSGPTGVGKTEISRQLGTIMGMPLIRFDMSEYMEQHSVSKLIGAPPGYVGFEQGGALTDAISKTPHAIVLLDEIEKAHPSIYNVLLQVMDYGIITDHHGVSVNCRNVILIMTTNAGAIELAKHGLGFGQEQREGEDTDAINRTFSPEFRNRLDAIIPFGPLNEPTMTRIVDKFLKELDIQLTERHITLKMASTAKKWLIKHGFDAKYGARPLVRTIDEYVKKPLADEILFGKLQKGGRALLEVKKDQLVLKYSPGSTGPTKAEMVELMEIDQDKMNYGE